MAQNAEILREYGKARQQRQKAIKLMQSNKIYCQMPGCQNTKSTRKGKYCVVCKVDGPPKVFPKAIEQPKYYYGK